MRQAARRQTPNPRLRRESIDRLSSVAERDTCTRCFDGRATARMVGLRSQTKRDSSIRKGTKVCNEGKMEFLSRRQPGRTR